MPTMANKNIEIDELKEDGIVFYIGDRNYKLKGFICLSYVYHLCAQGKIALLILVLPCSRSAG